MNINRNHHLVVDAEERDKIELLFDGSPHHNPKPQQKRCTLVIHAPTSASATGLSAHLKQKPPRNGPLPRSAHLIIERDGRRIIQMLPFQLGANHAFGFNDRSIAIDLVYPGELVEKGHSFQSKSRFQKDEYILASGLANARYGFWPLYPKAQLDTLFAVAKTLRDHYNNQQTKKVVDVVAYDEIHSAAHPGPAFPIIQFRERLLGVTDRSSVVQETSRSVRLYSQPGAAHDLLPYGRIPRGTPVAVINERFGWYLVSVLAEIDGNPWMIGWLEKNAVQVKTNFIAQVSADHYLKTREGRRFPEITPHQNGFEPSKRNPAPKFIIMHFTTGTRMESTINHFKNPASGVSTHLLIGRDGRVVQFLPFDRIAYHCGFSWWEQESNLNKCSIGIELENAGLLIRKDNKWQRNKIIVPDEEVQRAVHWKQYTPGDPRRYPGWQTFTDVQLKVALKIVKALVQRYPGIQEILGHDDVNLHNRYDPGPLFPMEDFRRKLFGRRKPRVQEYFINRPTEIYANFQGRLPNTNTRTFDAPLPKKSDVRVIRQEGDFALVSVIKKNKSKVTGTGWVQLASLDFTHHRRAKGTRMGTKTKPGKETTIARTVIEQPFFKRGERPPTPRLFDRPLPVGTRVRIQEFRGEWTLVVLLDSFRGRGGWEGWVPTEFLTKKET